MHLFGLCVDTNALRAVLPPTVDIVEDAACAAGGMLGDRSAGSLGRLRCFRSILGNRLPPARAA